MERFVIPAKAGIQELSFIRKGRCAWTPVFTGATDIFVGATI